MKRPERSTGCLMFMGGIFLPPTIYIAARPLDDYANVWSLLVGTLLLGTGIVIILFGRDDER